MITDVKAAYGRFEFYRVHQRIYQFCAVELSSFYLDVLKDRLYAEAAGGPKRRAAQYVLSRLHEVLTRLLAPILPHTAEELWDFVPGEATGGKEASVHLALLPEPDPRWDDPARLKRWERILELREKVMVALEGMRKQKLIGSCAGSAGGGECQGGGGEGAGRCASERALHCVGGGDPGG